MLRVYFEKKVTLTVESKVFLSREYLRFPIFFFNGIMTIVYPKCLTFFVSSSSLKKQLKKLTKDFAFHTGKCFRERRLFKLHMIIKYTTD